jgi:hypothetical protein
VVRSCFGSEDYYVMAPKPEQNIYIYIYICIYVYIVERKVEYEAKDAARKTLLISLI